MIIGIDLGTTNSLVAVWEDGRPRLIPNSLGEFLCNHPMRSHRLNSHPLGQFRGIHAPATSRS
ncbi:Hsp70 family protein [Ralstonia pickettii]|nr:Hsp70 family protein [Ralstonia pickettii]